jgi:transcriptional regulator GlxA family with amidase domain
MRIAIVTFEGCNEIDSFVALNMLNRVQQPGWRAQITCPSASVVSANGVRIEAQQPLEFANEADIVLVGSGRLTRTIIADQATMSRLKLNPTRQLIGSQCSGALVLAKLGLLRSIPACTDHTTRPFLLAADVAVLEKSFHSTGNIATAGGCLAAHYLATWVIVRALGEAAAEAALRYVVPVGEEQIYIARALEAVRA